MMSEIGKYNVEVSPAYVLKYISSYESNQYMAWVKTLQINS